MKKEVLFITLLFVIIISVACNNIDLSKLSDKDLQRVSKELIVCNPPYIRHASNCCLDKNGNAICDNDEKVSETPSGINAPVKETPAQPTHPETPIGNEKYKCKKNILSGYPPLDENTKNELTKCAGNELCYKSLISKGAVISGDKLILPENANMRMCELVEEHDAYYVCYRTFAYAKQDPCICGLADNKKFNDLFQEACYSEVGKVMNDENICNMITNDNPEALFYKSKCLEAVGVSKQDVNICETIPSAQGYSDRSSCYFQIAMIKQDPTICQKEYADTCYGELGIRNKDLEMCNKVVNDIILKGRCLYEVAKAKQDSSLCSQIVYGGWRNQCNKDFGLA